MDRECTWRELDQREKTRNEERKLRKSISVVEFTSKEAPKPEPVTDEDEEPEVEIPDYVLHEALLVMRDFVGVKGNRLANVLEKKESL